MNRSWRGRASVFVAVLAIGLVGQAFAAAPALAARQCVSALPDEEGNAPLLICVNAGVTSDGRPHLSVYAIRDYTVENTPPPIVWALTGVHQGEDGSTILEVVARVDGFAQVRVFVYLTGDLDQTGVCINEPPFLQLVDCILLSDYIETGPTP